jgi:diacylglycerol O-acyltransferase
MAVRLSDRDALSGNHSGAMIVPVVLDADEDRRLVDIGSATARAKRVQGGAVPQGLMGLLGVTGLMRFFIRRQHMVHVLATNLAGPPFPLYLAGARLLDAFAVTPVAGNVTASFAALSYAGRLDLSVDADAQSWPDLDVLIGGMEAGWRRLTASRAAA